ncbi:MAG: phosphate starvation-inducible protein PhoH [Acidimicrobiia bacterium]
MLAILGEHDRFLRTIEDAFDVAVAVRGNEITIKGNREEAERVSTLFEELIDLVRGGHTLDPDQVGKSIQLVKERPDLQASQVFGDRVFSGRGRQVRPKSIGQKAYVDAIRDNTVVFAIGPAGTGKTYLAVAAAVQALQDGQTRRIILTRPAVEAGEKLGYLPGDILAKVDPYLRPLYDSLYDIMDPGEVQKLISRGTIEIAPLAYMRGRTLNDSFVLLDEAQNTSPEQMKMFLTRIGFGSKAVVNGDVTQIDLPAGHRSGLVHVEGVLAGVPGIAFVHLDGKDVVRHEIVKRIIEAYDRYEAAEKGKFMARLNGDPEVSA